MLLSCGSRLDIRLPKLRVPKQIYVLDKLSVFRSTRAEATRPSQNYNNINKLIKITFALCL